VVRGGVLARLEDPAVGAQLVTDVGALEPGCLAAAWQGYQTGLYLGLAHDSGSLARVVEGLPSEVRSALSGPLKAAQTTQDRGGIWVLPEAD
jgi:hypothetical protein